MNTLEANIRNTKTKGELNSLRDNGEVPAIIYGGEAQNEKVSISKKLLTSMLEDTNFLSTILTLNVNGKPQNVLPREVKYHIISDEPIHVDFLRVVPGLKIRIEVPVKFINHEKSPGLKKGGVLNIVRRKVELKCPSEKIPDNLLIDLDGVDIGVSFKISSISLDPEVVPTIQGRDFVIATLAAPTVMKEPENQLKQKPLKEKQVQKVKQLKEINQQLRVTKKKAKISPLKKKNKLFKLKFVFH